MDIIYIRRPVDAGSEYQEHLLLLQGCVWRTRAGFDRLNQVVVKIPAHLICSPQAAIDVPVAIICSAWHRGHVIGILHTLSGPARLVNRSEVGSVSSRNVVLERI